MSGHDQWPGEPVSLPFRRGGYGIRPYPRHLENGMTGGTMNLRKVLLFVALAYLGSWGLLGIFVLAGGRLDTLAGAALAIAYMFVPMLAALVVQRGVYGQPVREPLGISFRVNRWWLVAWLLPVVLLVGTIGASLFMPGVSFAPGLEGLVERYGREFSPEEFEAMLALATLLPVHPFFLGVGLGLLAGVTVNAVAAFGEELGWRGLLHRELLPLGFWRLSAVIGAVWGFWHAPLILLGHNYPQNPGPGVFFMLLFTILISPVFTYVRIRSDSVIPAAILHGTMNGLAGLSLLVLRGGTDLTVGLTGLAGMLVLAIANLLLLLSFSSFSTGRSPPSGPS